LNKLLAEIQNENINRQHRNINMSKNSDKDKIIILQRKTIEDLSKKASAMEQEIALLNFEKNKRIGWFNINFVP
jgi:hypothetical protein